MPGQRPRLYLLAGPNGAGKSTLYDWVIAPKVNAEFVNADLIEREQNDAGFPIDSYEAARMASARRDALIAARKTFVTETVFSHKSKNALVEQARSAGYLVAILHVNVSSADTSARRVAFRASQGGHDVPEDKIRQRYARSQALIRKAALEADRAYIFDNSRFGRKPRLVVEMLKGRIVRVDRIPSWVRSLYRRELYLFLRS